MTDKQKLDAIRAEIHRLVDVRCYNREMANDLFAFMDSLQEEPVSEDLEEAAENYASTDEVLPNGKVMIDFQAEKAFKAGANWQKQQLMAKAVDATVHIDAGGYPYIPQMELYDYDKDIPLAKEGEKVKVIVIKED